MKRLIVEEVNDFRAEVRAQAKASGQIRRTESEGLPMPSRDDLLNSPMQGQEGGTSSFTQAASHQRPSSPIMDDPSASLERELAGTHLGGSKR